MSDKILVMLLGHKSLVGKDTFFNIASDEGFVRVAFADKLKSTVADLYNFSHDQMHGNTKDVMDNRYVNKVDPQRILCRYDDPDPSKEEGITDLARRCFTKLNPDFKPFLTPRRVLQIFGQDQRKLFTDIWASYIFNVEIPKLIKAGNKKIIVTDFRFTNEANVALKWGEENDNVDLKFVKINRPSVTAKSGAADISENDLNDFDKWNAVIDNSGSLESYQDSVLKFLNTL